MPRLCSDSSRSYTPHPHDSGTVRAQRCENNNDLHPYDQEPDPQGSQKPTGFLQDLIQKRNFHKLRALSLTRTLETWNP